jgi:hypothetical protein
MMGTIHCVCRNVKRWRSPSNFAAPDRAAPLEAKKDVAFLGRTRTTTGHSKPLASM